MTSTGERVNLDEDVFTVVAGGQESFNVSIDAWDPDAGLFSVGLSAHDRYGRELEHIAESVVARESGWNVGISSLSQTGTSPSESNGQATRCSQMQFVN